MRAPQQKIQASSQATTRLVSIPNKVDGGYDEAFFYIDRRRRDGIADPLPLMPTGPRLPLLRKDGREECRGKWRTNRCSSFVSQIVQCGGSVKESMKLAHHHDADPTFGRYVHTRLEDLSKVVDRLPDL